MKGARQVGLEINADKKSKMGQEKSRLEIESVTRAKKASKSVQAKKFQSVGDLRASVAEARNIAASMKQLNQDYKIGNEQPLKVSPQIVDGKVTIIKDSVERFERGEIQGGNQSLDLGSISVEGETVFTMVIFCQGTKGAMRSKGKGYGNWNKK